MRQNMDSMFETPMVSVLGSESGAHFNNNLNRLNTSVVSESKKKKQKRPGFFSRMANSLMCCKATPTY